MRGKKTFYISFTLKNMPQKVTEHEYTNGAYRIHKKRMGSIEGVNKSSLICIGPSVRLNCATYFQGELIKILLPRVHRYSGLLHQAEQITVGTYIVKAMVVDTDMANMRGH